jgi:hypothetical protein
LNQQATSSSFEFSLQGLTFSVLQDVVKQLRLRENNLLHLTFRALAEEYSSSNTPGQFLSAE